MQDVNHNLKAVGGGWGLPRQNTRAHSILDKFFESLEYALLYWED